VLVSLILLLTATAYADAVTTGGTGLAPWRQARTDRSAFLLAWWSVWDDHHHYIEEIADMGNGVIYVVIREDSRIRGSEERIEQTVAHVWQWVDRLIERQTIYRDPDEARADAERLAREPA
jgi:hypothetical protein